MAKKTLSVFVAAPIYDEEYALMAKLGYPRAITIEAADIVFFVGGADVNPRLYGEDPIYPTAWSDVIDRRDVATWRLSTNKIKIGVCRGGQFLNVMNGGTLWQDVDNHTTSHLVLDQFTGKHYMCTSTHHQQFRPAPLSVPIGVARESTRKKSDGKTWELKNNNTPVDNYFKIDHEVLWYPETKSLCFQPHPEYNIDSECAGWFEEVLGKCIRNEYDKSKLPGKVVL